MKHFMLKFNHGIEIGAALAYMGHFKRTQDLVIDGIIKDEIEHRSNIKQILIKLNEKPSPIIDNIFNIVGNTIKFSCNYSPVFLLDIIASLMESFAIFNYRQLSKEYPEFKDLLSGMADKEDEHRKYFKA